MNGAQRADRSHRLARIAAPASILLALTIAGTSVPGDAAERRELATAVGPVHVERVATGLKRPWAMTFLPDGGMLVTEEAGRLLRISPDGEVVTSFSGLPPIYTKGNGGLFDIKLDPAFVENSTIYFAFAEPAGDGSGKAGTSVARATVRGDRLENLQIIFQQSPKVADERNFGGRLLFDGDGRLFVMLGDRFAQDLVQPLDNTIGTVVRIASDGSVPSGNPFADHSTAAPEIWSYGHRNIEGAALHPETGALWIHEFGPDGGGELNIVEAGRNYGWPLTSWGRHYSGKDIPDPPARPELARSIFHWNPVVSPSGMAFYTGDLLPEWRGNLMLGGLSSHWLVRLTLRGDRVVSEERIDLGARIRDVVQGPDGALYLLTDQPKGEILRLTASRRGKDHSSFEESVPN